MHSLMTESGLDTDLLCFRELRESAMLINIKNYMEGGRNLKMIHLLMSKMHQR